MLRGALRVGLPALLVAACGGGMDVTPGRIEFSGPPGSAEPNLMVTSAGDVVLSWHQVVAGEKTLFFSVRSGATWSEPRVVAAGLPFLINWADFPSLFEFADGTWGVHWLQKPADAVLAYDVMIAFSPDRGATWSEPFTPHHDSTLTEHGFASFASWGSDVGALWLDGRQTATEPPGPTSLRFARLGPAGQIGTDVLVDDRVCDCCNTAMAAVSDGLIIAYRDRSETEVRDIAVRRYSNNSFGEPQHVGDDNWVYPGCPVNGPALSASGNEVALAWYTAPDQRARVNVAFSEDGGRTFGEVFRVDEGATLGRVDVELVGEGLALVTSLEQAGDSGSIRARLVGSDGTLGRPRLIAVVDPSRDSGFPRVVRTGDQLIFAWTVPGAGGGVRAMSGRIQ